MSKPHWIPFYANDFLASSKVALLTTEEVGAYVLLLCHAWQDPQCSLPDDDEALSILGRIKGDMTNVRACFAVKKHRLVNERLYQEWIKVKEKSELAKKSIALRWKNERNTNVIRTLYSSQSQSESELQSESESKKELKREKKEKSSGVGKDSTPTVNGVETWQSYAEAYRGRYHVDPVRNQQTNSHLKQLVKRLGVMEAPLIAAFYLSHNKPIYVSARHPTSVLLRDCEGLRTEWATGIQSTSGEARNLELKDNVVEQVKRVEALMKGRTL